MNNCKNTDECEEVTFEEFLNLEKTDISKIKCNICNVNDKSNTNEMFKCIRCIAFLYHCAKEIILMII